MEKATDNSTVIDGKKVPYKEPVSDPEPVEKSAPPKIGIGDLQKGALS